MDMYVLHEWLKLHITIFNGYKYNYIGLTELFFFQWIVLMYRYIKLILEN
jgi:hypothetical protein